MSFSFGASAGGGAGGTSGFGGFGAAQPAAAASPFGGGVASTFGAAPSAFGAGSSAFGAPKPATTGFGGFGGAAAPAATTGSMFGAAQPATGGFGSAFGGGGAATSGGFGAPAAPSAGGFGAPTVSSGFGAGPSAFGAGVSSFGAPAAGATSAFGSAGSPFGAKPAASSSPFGATSLFGGASNPSATSAFGGGGATTGGFGGGTSAFGTPAPGASSGSLFGGGFGSAAKSPFGTSATTTTSAFGAPATSGFGAVAGGGFGAGPMGGAPQVGTGNPPYQAMHEPEPTGTGTGTYVSISKMSAYQHKSVEELRYEDYLKRTDPAAAQAAAALNPPSATATSVTGAGAFGSTPSAFGATAQPAPTSAFGSAFGGSSFGAPTTSGFGATTGSFGGFGSQPATGAAGSTGGLFGGGARSSFGTPAATQPTSAFGAPTTSGFGAATGGGTGAFGSTGGFGNAFGATSTPQQQPQQSAFGGFGATATPATGGFGSTSAFGKPAGTTGFGGFGTTPTAAPTTSAFSSFGAPAQQTATSSLFGGAAPAPTTGSSFSFGGAGAKPATSGFSFGGTSTGGGFGSTSTGSAFGSTSAAPSAFGMTSSQPLGSTSLFGSTTGASTGGFSGFGSSAAPMTGGSSLFGGAKPTGSGLFGSTTATAPGSSMFGSTSTGTSSLFGGTAGGATSGNSGFGGFGSSSFGNATGGGGFGGFGSATTSTPQLGFGSSGGSMFGSAQPQAPAAPAQPQNLVAAPDVNPYGAGSFGAGLVEQNVNAALGLQTIKTGSSASRLSSSFTDDIGLPRGPMEPPLSTRRQLASGRSSVPVSFIRSTFKGSKSRYSSFSSGSLATGSSSVLHFSSDSATPSQDDEFKFSSSLFRNSVVKKLVIDKSEPSRAESSARGNGSRASVIPLGDDERGNDTSSGAVRSRALRPDVEGNYPVLFRNLTNRKSFTLRLHARSTIKSARNEVNSLLRASSSSSSRDAVGDIELVWKGRIVQDSMTIEDLRLKEGDIIDVVVIEDHSQNESKAEEESSMAAKKKSVDAASSMEASKTGKRFMTYDEFLASAIREEEDEDALVDARHRAPSAASCPVLKNADFFTRPSYDRLQRMTDSELSEVDGFTVGCKGLGSVEWIGKTDVRHLNLDELVFFEKKEVIVYKDDDQKHELGSGLNRPAIVELLGIFPPRKSSSAEAYREKVKERTSDIGATFLDYSAATGVWRFRVEHFSRYGFDDDDEDDDDEEEGGDVNMERGNGSTARGASTSVKIASVGRPFGAQPQPSSAVFSTERAGVLRRSAVYGSAGLAVASFREPSAVAAPLDELRSLGGARVELSGIHADAPDASAFDADTLELEPAPEAPCLAMSTAFAVSASFPVKPLGIDSESSSLPPGSKSSTYQMMLQASSQQACAVRNNVDAGMFMARSFRCSWGPNGELVNIGKVVSSRRAGDSSAQRVRIEFPLKVGEEKKQLVKEGLDLHFACATKWGPHHHGQPKSQDFYEGEDASAHSTRPPEYALPSDDNIVRCLHKYVAFAESMAKRNPRSAGYKNAALLWKLIQALWGQEYGATDSAEDLSRVCPLAARDDTTEAENFETFQSVDLRREAISKWFEETVATAYPASSSSSSEEDAMGPSQYGVLRLICQHRVVEAAEMAMACGDFRLATLISQALTYEGSDFRSLLVNQLSQWDENGTIEFMEPELVLVYSLLAGSVEVVTAQQVGSMPWLACLALFFWYRRGPATSLKSALGIYMDAVAKDMATGPASRFAEKKDDLLLEVMKLYVGDAVSLCNVLSPSGFMSARLCHLDYETSWHLHSVLRAVGYKLDRKWESHIHQNFIRQLEGMCLWEEALYVSLNISSAEEREHTCRAILFRNADILSQDKKLRDGLSSRLGVPVEWVSEALAVRAVAKNEYHDEIAFWMAARHYEEAHLCLVTHVAPPCLFAGENEVLFQLLSELETSSAEISQWQTGVDGYTVGGGLLLEYLRLERQDGLEVGREEDILERVLALAQQLSSICDSAGGGDSPERLVAKTALSSMIVSLSTQAVQLQKILSFTQEQQGVGVSGTPLELRADFLGKLSSLTTGRESMFVESYRSSQLIN
ncbi:hypothetical protein PybrP1_004970, partial [[Pythium] brassicae (nom. inval.)]